MKARRCYVLVVMTSLVGVAHAKETVLVVGAGFAGLTAASDLTSSGYDVIVLEARDRIGGRAYTDRSTGIDLDMGCSWIIGTEQNEAYDLAAEAGVPVSAHTDWNLTIKYSHEGAPVSYDSKKEEEFFERVIQRSRWHSLIGSNKTMEEMLLRMYDRGAFSDLIEDKDELYFLSNRWIELEYAGDLSLLSAQQTWEGEEMPGDSVIIPGGYDQLTDYLARDVDIRLNTVVQKVTYRREGVTVSTSNGEFEGERAVITVPIGVLKAGDIEFEPPLPKKKRTAIDRMGSGTLNKTWLIFPETFWDADQLMISYLNEPSDQYTEWYSFDDLESSHALLVFNAGAHGLAMEEKTDAVITEEAMTALRVMYGDEIPDPIDVLQSRWGSDPYAKGAYSFMGVGMKFSDREKLREPVMNRVFFAGEATSVDYPGTTIGAIQTGARAAQEIADLCPRRSGCRGAE